MKRNHNPFPRFIIGKSQANGFTSFSNGDVFECNGKNYNLCSGVFGWTLRPALACDGWRTDYIAPPLDGWIEIPSAFELMQKLNQAFIDSN